MRKLVLFAAMSLDGYLAKTNHAMDWLVSNGSDDTTSDLRYTSFYETISTLVMGRITYEQIVHHLSPNTWPYPHKKSYIFSSQSLKSDNPDILFVQKNVIHTIQNEKKQLKEGDIWLVGGAQLIQTCVKHDIIDKYIISIIPTLLGDGIPLFLPQTISEQKLKLESHSIINGIVELTYVKH